ncbi:MAG: GntR family transcriptional regulator [Pseudomonadota bacterium]
MSGTGGSVAPLTFHVPGRIADEIALHLEWQIVFGELAAGERLREEVVTAQTGVSRSPIRAAFDQLEHDGLLVRLPRRGVVVAPLSLEDLLELYGVRISLEGQAANEAARSASTEDVALMTGALNAMREAHDGGDIKGFFRANVQLSAAAYSATGSATLQRLLGIIEKQARRYRFMAFERRPNLMAASVAGNERFIEIVEAGDGDTAEALMRQLIARSRDELAEALAGVEGFSHA